MYIVKIMTIPVQIEQLQVEPRRMKLPPTFAQDEEWRNIGSRRTEFLDLGMPRFGPPRKILVQSKAEPRKDQKFSFLFLDLKTETFL